MKHLPADANLLFYELSTNQSLCRFIPLLTANDRSVVVDHVHNFDHLTRCDTGKIHVVAGVEEFDLSAGDEPINVPAGVLHSAWALEDNSLMVCEFTNRDAEGRIVTGVSTREAHV